MEKVFLGFWSFFGLFFSDFFDVLEDELDELLVGDGGLHFL